MANQSDDYTSLYWNPTEGGEKSENEYEVVEEGNRYFGGGLLRGIRESILRELRRDLARFTKSDRVYSRYVAKRSVGEEIPKVVYFVQKHDF